jgi:CspA family cold shock protein
VRAWTTVELPSLQHRKAPFHPGIPPGRKSMQEALSMTIGTVKFFNTTKGFGFIAPEGGAKDVFVHATALEAAGMTSLSEGQKVSFDIQPDAKGSKAVNLKTA